MCLAPRKVYNDLKKGELSEEIAMRSLIVAASTAFARNTQKTITPRWRCTQILAWLMLGKLVVFLHWVSSHFLLSHVRSLLSQIDGPPLGD